MSTNPVKIEKPIRVIQLLFYLNAAIWLVFGLISLYRIGSGESAYLITMFVIAVLMFGNVMALLIAGYVVRWPRKHWFWLATAVILINIILTFTDQMGVFDLLTLFLDVIILGLLIANRDWFGL